MPLRCLALATVLAIASSNALGQTCTFRNPPTALAFPSLDPSVAATVTATAEFRVDCPSAPSWSFSNAGGGQPRLTQGTVASIPYAAAVARATPPGPNNNQRWNLTLTVLGPDYQNARAGSYTGQLVITILP